MKVIKAAGVLLFFFFWSCEWQDEWFIADIPNNIVFHERLSSYGLFRGEMHRLLPADDVYPYTLATPLFTDYAEKQRLFKLPEGSKLTANGSSLPGFPEGAVLAKTFYYYTKKATPGDGKIIVETRLLIKEEHRWNVGVYQWNEKQDEAFLVEEGRDVNLEGLENEGNIQQLNYRIPSNKECTTCHQSSGLVQPIGPKLRNLNVLEKASPHGDSQLVYWLGLGLIDKIPGTDNSFMPDWKNEKALLSLRARAYLDVNCAHCHSPGGVASDWRLNLDYETPYTSTGIAKMRSYIQERMESKWADEKMPKLGTSVIHKEGVALIKEFLR